MNLTEDELRILTQVIRTHRGTRRRAADTSSSSRILLLAHSLYSNDTSGDLLLLLQQVNGMVNANALRECVEALYIAPKVGSRHQQLWEH